MNADIAVGKMQTPHSFGITPARITVHYTYKEEIHLMSNYTPEYEIDDFVDNCECCAMNISILEGDNNG